MNKDKALERLNAIEQEQRELGKIIENADKPKNIMDRIKTYENACDVLGCSYKMWSDYDTEDEIAYKKLKIITKVLNENHKKDWTNPNEPIYFPWFEIANKPGSGFDHSSCYSWGTWSGVSSRLGFKSRELAIYAAKQFEQIYHIYMVIKD